MRRRLVGSFFSLAVLLTLGGLAIAQEDSKLKASESADAEKPAAEGEQQEQLDAKAVMEEGNKALEDKDYEKALAAFDKLTRALERAQSVEAYAALPLAYTGRAKALVGLKEYEAAIEDFKKVTDINKDYTPALIARGEMYLDIGAADRALPDFQAAVKADRSNIKAQFGLGKAFAMLGGAQQAIGPLDNVIKADPKNAEAYRLRGSAYAGFKMDKAMADLQEAVSLDPDDYQSYFFMGVIFLRAEDYPQAVKFFDKAIETYKPKPDQEDDVFEQGYLTKAAALIEMGKASKDPAEKKAAYQAAVDEANKLLKLTDEKNPAYAGRRAGALFSRGVSERMLGRYSKAIATLTEAIELNPDLSEGLLRRGICFHLIGEDRNAIADFKHAANIDFEDPRANLWEGFLYAKMGNYHEAVRAYGDAINASDRYTPAYVNRGLAYMQLGQYEKAIDDLSEAIRLEPTRAEHYFKRGVAYEQVGNKEKAADSFASAIELDDKNAEAYSHMAKLQQALGNGELAREYQQKATELAPKKKNK